MMSRKCVKSVVVECYESSGAEGRGGESQVASRPFSHSPISAHHRTRLLSVIFVTVRLLRSLRSHPRRLPKSSVSPSPFHTLPLRHRFFYLRPAHSLSFLLPFWPPDILQLLTYFTIDPPSSLSASDLIAAKVALLKCIPPLLPEQTLLGQYTASKTDPNKRAYTDDETVVDKATRAETFAETVFWVENERWRGVPCVMRCGKVCPTNYAARSL